MEPTILPLKDYTSMRLSSFNMRIRLILMGEALSRVRKSIGRKKKLERYRQSYTDMWQKKKKKREKEKKKKFKIKD